MVKLKVDKDPLIKYLIEEKGVPARSLDLNNDNRVEFAEAAAFALREGNWKKYLSGLDIAGLKHPLDTRNYDPKIRARIAELAEQAVFETETRMGLTRDDPAYCDVLLTNFLDSGKPSFEEGGLCFGYSEWYVFTYDPANEVEKTSKESLDICLNKPKDDLGSCTEHSYMQKGSTTVAAETHPQFDACQLDYMNTENHAYTARNGKSYDASEIGPIGWSVKSNPAADYYFSLRDKTNATPTDTTNQRIANLIDPYYTDTSEVLELLSKGQYEKALDKIELSVNSKPKAISVFMFTIPWLESNLSPEEAEKFAFMVMHRFPSNPYALLAVTGLKNFASDRLRLAAKLKNEFPQSGYAELVEGWIFQEASDFLSATIQFDKALAINPNNAYALNSKANLLLALGRLDEAKTLLDKAIQIAPNLSMNHYLLASIHMLKGELPAALEEAKRERLVFVNNNASFFLSSQIYLNMGMPAAVFDMMNNFIDKILDAYEANPDPAYLEAWKPTLYQADYNLFNSCILLGDFECVSQVLSFMNELGINKETTIMLIAQAYLFSYDSDIVLEITKLMDPKLLGAKYMKFQAYLQKNDLVKAREIMINVRTAMPDSPLALTMEAQVELFSGNLEHARTLFENALSLNPYDWASKLQIASIDYELGGSVEAKKAMEELGFMFSDIASVQSYRAFNLYLDGEVDEAIEIAVQNYDLNPYDLAAMTVIGLAALDGKVKKGVESNLDLAIKVGESLFALRPNDVEGLVILARAYLQKGDFENAMFYANIANENWTKSNLKPLYFAYVGDLQNQIRDEAATHGISL